MRRVFRIACGWGGTPAVVLAAALLCACGAHRTYEGELPDDDVAIVTGSRTVTGVRIFFRGWNADGEEIVVYKIEVPAGPQRIKVHFTAPSGTHYRYGRTIRFTAIGGHTYQIKGVEWDDDVYIWVQDMYTHEVVGGEQPE